VVIEDNGPLDVNPQVGVVRYDGPIGNWSMSISSGQSDPFIGTPSAPDMDLHSVNFSSQPATLIVQYSETNLTTFPNETYINVVGYNTTGTVSQNSYRDSGNVLFGSTATYPSDAAGISPSPTALLLSSVGPVTGFATVSNGVIVSAIGNAPNSLTIETIVNHPGAGSTSVDAHLYTVPQPPCNCTLTFSGPSSVTNCPDDAFPDITAQQDCGAGAVNVPVTLASSTTNGSCPAIVTRNFTATDSCGTVHPFTQTITVNCKPNCTITTSVTSAIVGSTNSASVANAGPGATYSWTILNGTPISGQNSTTFKWQAGTDTNNPVSVFVTVTAATGCQSSCSASVALTPQPPKQSLGGGDAATIGFWHNKNGQGLINGAPSGPPTLANWLATTLPCLYGATAPAADNLTGKNNATVAALFMTKFGATGQAKQESQIMAVALATYFTSTSLGGGAGPVKFGFNQSPDGTGAKTINVGTYGTALGLTNNTSYTIMQILQAANDVRCGNPTAPIPYDLFNSINTKGDI